MIPWWERSPIGKVGGNAPVTKANSTATNIGAEVIVPATLGLWNAPLDEPKRASDLTCLRTEGHED